MSWSEIKKSINSDLDKPLNELIKEQVNSLFDDIFGHLLYHDVENITILDGKTTTITGKGFFIVSSVNSRPSFKIDGSDEYTTAPIMVGQYGNVPMYISVIPFKKSLEIYYSNSTYYSYLRYCVYFLNEERGGI